MSRMPRDGEIVTVAMGDEDAEARDICATPEGAWCDIAPYDPDASGTILWFDAPAFAPGALTSEVEHGE